MAFHVAEEAARYMGGRRVLCREVTSDQDLASLVLENIPVEAVEPLLDQELLSPDELYALVIPRRTLTKRRSTTGRLSTEESDNLVRVARVLALAGETFQSIEKASAWLRRPNRSLGGTPPIAFLATDAGSRLVEAELGRIEYGVYS